MPIKDRIRKNDYAREYYGKHKKTINARRRQNYQDHGRQYYRNKYENLRNEILALLGNCCSKCGFSDKRALEIDHVHGSGNKHIHSFKSNYSYLISVKRDLENGSKDYQCLCANCNQIKRAENNENRKIV